VTGRWEIGAERWEPGDRNWEMGTGRWEEEANAALGLRTEI